MVQNSESAKGEAGRSGAKQSSAKQSGANQSGTVTQKDSTPKIGQRRTRQKTAVLAALESLDSFVSAKQIHQELDRRGDSVGLTTVYRTLQSLVEMGEADVLHTNSGEAIYRHCQHETHHHHLVCTNCGKAVEIVGGAVESWAKEEAARNGYTMSGHSAEIFGLCPDCQKLEA